MNKQPQDALLEARLLDAARRSAYGGPRFVGFLDEREAALAQRALRKAGFENDMLWGGYDGAERVVVGLFPQDAAPDKALFPVVPVTAFFRACDVLTHRDFLGALMSAGIQRDTVGDLLVEEGRCVLFLRAEIADFVLAQTEKIGGVGVKLRVGAEEPLPQGMGFAAFSAVIASARLDCAVAAALSTSREKAAALIASGGVLLNHEEIVSVSAAVRDGDKLSVRGKGRFILDSVGPVTKKGRLALSGRKYI